MPISTLAKTPLSLILFICVSNPGLMAEPPRNAGRAPIWLADVAPLVTGQKNAFSCSLSHETGAEHLRRYASWAPPDRRCLILRDALDGLRAGLRRQA